LGKKLLNYAGWLRRLPFIYGEESSAKTSLTNGFNGTIAIAHQQFPSASRTKLDLV